jgi:hypothetical protein
MKTSLALTAILIAASYCATVPALSQQQICACRERYDNCIRDAEGGRMQCKMLYEAALKEGGLWGSPKARAASKTTGYPNYCHVDFE